MAQDINITTVKKNIAFVIFDSKIIPLENRREQLLIDLLVLLTKNPRNNPKNKSNIICLGRSTKGKE